MRNFDKIYEELMTTLEEIGTSIASMMGTEPINLAGKEMPSKKYSKEGKKSEKNAMYKYKYKKTRSKANWERK